MSNKAQLQFQLINIEKVREIKKNQHEVYSNHFCRKIHQRTLKLVSVSPRRNRILMDIECYSKQTQDYLVHTKRSLMFGTVQNVHTSLRKCPLAQRAHNVYFYFCFTGFMHKKYYHVLLVQKVCFGCTANNNPSYLCSFPGNSRWGQLVGSAWTKCPTRFKVSPV